MLYIEESIGGEGIQYHYLDVSKITRELLIHLRIFSSTCTIVLGVEYFSTFN
jgi:hypothetical protein